MVKRLAHTGIEYAINPDGTQGYGWNFYPGCLHKQQGVCPVPQCWAEIAWKRQMGSAAKKSITLPDFHHPHLIPELLLAPLSIKKPSIILVNFMGDLFGDWVNPSGYDTSIVMPNGQSLVRCHLVSVVKTILYYCPQHTSLFLTKNPKGLIPWSPFPDNAWVGVTVWDNDSFFHALYDPPLSAVKAKHKWLSIEPLLGEIHIKPIDLTQNGIDWVVIGGQTNPIKYPDISWIFTIVKACDQAGVKVWLKNNLYKMLMERPAVDHDLYWQTMSELRQERPI